MLIFFVMVVVTGVITTLKMMEFIANSIYNL